MNADKRPITHDWASTLYSSGTFAAIGHVEIPLPGDDAGAVRVLCAILHYDRTTTASMLDPQDILAIAILADKYECVGALWYFGHFWFSQALQAGSLEQLSILMLSAYLLNQNELFGKLGHRVATTGTGSIFRPQVEASRCQGVLCEAE